MEIDTRTDRVSEFLAQLVLSIRQKKAGPNSFTLLRGLLIITSFPTVINTKNSIASAPQHWPFIFHLNLLENCCFVLPDLKNGHN